MSHLVQLEIGAVFLICWVVSLVAMWFLVDRTTRPGIILGLTFAVWGTGAAD